MKQTITAMHNGYDRKPARVGVVGYIRVSTDNQVENGQGLPIQKESILAFCKSNPNYNLVEIYEDAGISGSSDSRPGLLRLLEDAKLKKFEIVIVSKLDRIARDTFLTLWIEKELKKYDISLTSISEPYRWDDPAQKIFLQMISAFAEFEKSRIVERLLSGRIRKISNGRYAGGKPPLGYRTKAGELVIDDREAQIIQRIYRLRFGRKSMQRIADILNAEGTMPKHGRKFYASTIQYILKNKIYKGFIRYGGRSEKGIHQRIDIFKKQPHLYKDKVSRMPGQVPKFEV